MARHAAVFGTIALLGAALDLLTKHLAFARIPVHGEVSVIEGFFHFGRVTNDGVIFGMGQGARVVWLVVSILAVPAIVAIFLSVRKPKWILTVAFGLILAGTIGNMIDRVTVGAVRDFIKVYYWKNRVWPLFNLADSFICVGVLLLSIEMLFLEEKAKKPDELSQAPAAPPPGPADGSP